MMMLTDLTSEEQRIYDLSEAWSRAIVANDPEQIGSFMADDWLMVSEHGVADRERFLSLVASGQLTHDSMDLAELHSVRIYSDTAMITARVTNTAHFGGQTFDANEWTTDVFVKRDGEWKCVLTHITPALKWSNDELA